MDYSRRHPGGPSGQRIHGTLDFDVSRHNVSEALHIRTPEEVPVEGVPSRALQGSACSTAPSQCMPGRTWCVKAVEQAQLRYVRREMPVTGSRVKALYIIQTIPKYIQAHLSRCCQSDYRDVGYHITALSFWLMDAV